MISGYVIGDKEVMRHLSLIPSKVRARLGVVILRLSIGLQAKVKSEKLSGQVLRRRTGTLSRSISRVVLTDTNSVTGIVSTNVKYARKHEYGFHGTETVKAHMRMMKTAWGRPVANPHQIAVKTFSRQVDYPERSFLRTSLREMRPEVVVKINAAIHEAVQ